jgi:hypothetical protein
MESLAQSSAPSSPQPIPDDLLQRLHDANHRFHQGKDLLERTMDGSEFRHQERVDAASRQLQQVQLDLEQITHQIQQFLSHRA